MSISTRNTPSSRLPRIGAIGIALAGGLLLAGQAAAIQPLAISAVAMSATAEGKCGEGKCGANKATTGKPAGKAKVAEGQCGEGKCGDASFARTDRDHDGYISEQEAHDYLRSVYTANGKPMPKGLFSRVAD